MLSFLEIFTNEIRKFEISIGEFEGEGMANIPSGLLRRERKAFPATAVTAVVGESSSAQRSFGEASEEVISSNQLRRTSKKRSMNNISSAHAIQEDRNEDRDDSASYSLSGLPSNRSHFSNTTRNINSYRNHLLMNTNI